MEGEGRGDPDAECGPEGREVAPAAGNVHPAVDAASREERYGRHQDGAFETDRQAVTVAAKSATCDTHPPAPSRTAWNETMHTDQRKNNGICVCRCRKPHVHRGDREQQPEEEGDPLSVTRLSGGDHRSSTPVTPSTTLRMTRPSKPSPRLNPMMRCSSGRYASSSCRRRTRSAGCSGGSTS